MHAAASLAGLDVPSATDVLAELCEASLLTQHQADRYSCHDLLRAYAAELTEEADSEPQRRAAIERTLNHYLQTATSASILIYPHWFSPELTAPLPGIAPTPLGDAAEAMGWFGAERACLLAAIVQAAANGFTRYSWELALAVQVYLRRRSHWHDILATGRIILEATLADGQIVGQAFAHSAIGAGLSRLGRLEEAKTHGERALARYEEAGLRAEVAGQHRALSVIAEREGRYRDALHHSQEALRLFEAEGDSHEAAITLNSIGWFHAMLGDHRQTLVYCRRALEILQPMGNVGAQAFTWDSLGYAHSHLGDDARAVDCYHRAIGLFQRCGNREQEAITLVRLGDLHDARGDTGLARDSWQAAHGILDDLRLPGAAEVRAKLDRLGGEADVKQARDRNPP